MIQLKKLLFEQTLGTAMLRQGSRGDNVTTLQKMLIDKGYLSAKLPSGKPADDGDFGPATKTAVINFQKDMIKKGVLPAKQKSGRTSADGIVGDDTKAALTNNSSSNTSNNSTTNNTTTTELPYGTVRDVNNTKEIIELLSAATAGIGTRVDDFRYAIRRIKDKETLDAVNKILKDSQYLYDVNPPNSTVTLSNGARVNTNWLNDYDSVEAIIEGELGWFDAEDKQLAYNLLNKLKGQGDPYGYDKDQDISLGPVNWFNNKIYGALKAVLFEIAPNVAQYLMPKNLIQKDLDEKFLGELIAKAIARGESPETGLIQYVDYGTEFDAIIERGGKLSAEEWVENIGKALVVPDLYKKFVYSTLLGRFTYHKNEDGTYRIEPDIYDFTKGGSITDNVTIDELTGLTWWEAVNLIKSRQSYPAEFPEFFKTYQAIRHIAHIENPAGGVRYNGEDLYSISADSIKVPTQTKRSAESDTFLSNILKNINPTGTSMKI
jgi:peptidoglycan hydrolase-like protein with peptidoglycan-binding domain